MDLDDGPGGAGAPAAGPLAGRRVLVTRPPHQAAELSDRIRAAGGTPYEAPTIVTGPGDRTGMHAAVRGLVVGRFVGVCVTSVNGVESLVAACDAAGVDPGAALRSPRFVGAVGTRTADRLHELTRRRADVVPAVATGAALGDALPRGGGELLLPRGDLAATDLDVRARTRGYLPVPVVAYRTTTAARLPDEIVAALAAGAFDLVTFTSASTVRGFVALVGDRPWSGRVVSIGPVTSAACAELGLDVAAEAGPHDLDGLVAALSRVAAT